MIDKNSLLKYLRYAAISLLVIYCFVMLYNIITHDRLWDFRAYYHAAALFAKGGNPYDFAELVESSRGYVTLPYVYPPLTLYRLSNRLLPSIRVEGHSLYSATALLAEVLNHRSGLPNTALHFLPVRF